MSSEKIRGLIIRENFYGESDKFLIIFAKDIGKISVFAKGARNTKSKFLASSSLFTYGDFIIRTATKTPTLISADVIENFYGIRSNFSAAAYASYFAEFTDKAFLENIPDNNALLLILKSLQKLSNESLDPRLAGCVFQLRLLDILGYRPDEKTTALYSLGNEALSAVNYILSVPLNSAFSIKASKELIRELEYFTEKYIEYHIDIKLKSYKILKDLIMKD
ncbi:MAG: DNA repair protein RecO [Clostridia bacterium]|nr:DNA repair protein RecO [Clostridia bacterium]